MNSQNIINSMALCANAYLDYLPQKAGAESAFYSSASGVQFFVKKWSDSMHIVFRGSNSALDWAHNLNFFKMDIPYGNTASKVRVHRGFIEAYKSEGVREEIHFLASGAGKICVSGHSYGAALAALAALDIQYNFGGVDIEAFLFGSPRIGNSHFSKSYNKRVVKTVNVQNGNDVVTKIPFPIMGFRHAGAIFHVGRPRVPLVFSAKDHYPMAYMKGLLQRLLP